LIEERLSSRTFIPLSNHAEQNWR